MPPKLKPPQKQILLTPILYAQLEGCSNNDNDSVLYRLCYSPPQRNTLPNLFNNNSKGGTPMCKYDSQPAAFSRMENEKLRRLRDLPTDEALKLFSALFFVWILKVWVHLPQQNTKSVV